VLAPEASERITILSPPNTISKLFNLRLRWAVEGGANTSGTKQIILDQQIDSSTGIGLFTFSGNYNQYPWWDQGSWGNAINMTPNDLSAMSNQINAGRFDEFKGIQLVFWNHMNSNAGSVRDWVLFVEREVVAR
jgi:hypothetical protein